MHVGPIKLFQFSTISAKTKDYGLWKTRGYESLGMCLITRWDARLSWSNFYWVLLVTQSLITPSEILVNYLTMTNIDWVAFSILNINVLKF